MPIMTKVNVFAGNRLEQLSAALAGRMHASPLAPLEKEVVVVQSRGMERWLNLQIADHLNICANLDCVFPRSFANRLFRQLFEAPEPDRFSAERLTWLILKTLPEVLDEPEFVPLRRYLNHDEDGLKRFQLAEQVAAVFERYLILRPDVIRDWEAGKDTLAAGFDDQRWQPVLWRRILAGLPQAAVRSHPPALAERLVRHPGLLPGLPKRLSVFGISTLAPFYLELLLRLSREIEVDVYYLNPCREFWEYVYSQKELLRLEKQQTGAETADLDLGNALLASLGGAGREFFSLLMENVEDAGRELFVDPGRDSLLAAVQSDILELVDGTGRPPDKVPPEDDSLQIHSCHTPMREVEVLHDRLLSLFEQYPDIQPRDVVVMMPDVSVYAPLIQAVFDSPEEAGRRIPYSITDASLKTMNTAAAPLLQIFDIVRHRYRSPAVLDLLETAMVRRRFGIAEADLDRIRKWVNEAGICWGIDGNYKEDLGLPGFHENTWMFGLDRLLLGYALPAESAGFGGNPMFSGILPEGPVEGADARLLGAFTNFVQTLFFYGRKLSGARPAGQWAFFLDRLMADFFEPAESVEENDLMEIRELLNEGIFGGARAAGFGEPVAPSVIRYYLEKRLSTGARNTGFLSAGVTFATLLPMRSIPFKVVCLLGMNDGDFPRISRQAGFDLVDKKRRPGDFSKRKEDRYLFLESLLSAREKLIISYVGQDIRDNSLLPPSSLVSELLDYVQNGFESEAGGNPADRIVTRHPLQPFSPRYFSDDSRLFSYSEHNFRAAAAGVENGGGAGHFCRQPLLPAGNEDWSRVSLEALAGFLANPAAFFLKKRLQIYLKPEDAGEPPEREPFEADPLESYQIKQDLTESYLADQDESTARRILTAAGRLPHGTPGEIMWTEYHRQVSEFAVKIRRLAGGEAEPAREIGLRLRKEPSLSVSGVLTCLYPSGQLFYRCAKLKAKDIVAAWIHHLAFQAAAGHKSRLTYAAGQDRTVCLAPLEAVAAVDELKKLVDLFFCGWQKPLPFFPETALAYAEKTAAGKRDRALDAARKRWRPGWNTPGESGDEYIRFCFEGDLPAHEDFQQTACTVFAPVVAAMTEIDPLGEESA